MNDNENSRSQDLPSLSQGLYLEHLGTMLEWYTSHRSARVLLSLEDHRDKDTLRWNKVECLGGLSCAIDCKFILDEAFGEKRCLRLIEFRVQPVEEEATERLYKRIKSHLRRQLGEPALEYDGEEGNLRSFVEWDSEEVMVMWKIIKSGSQESCLGELWRKPFPKEYLKLTLTNA